MKIPLSGGSSALSVFSDSKLRITFNRFTGDGLIKQIFPSSLQNLDGNYEALVDVSGVGSGSGIVKSVVLESGSLLWVMVAVVGMIAAATLLIFGMFKK